jgi:hypothetical protein
MPQTYEKSMSRLRRFQFIRRRVQIDLVSNQTTAARQVLAEIQGTRKGRINQVSRDCGFCEVALCKDCWDNWHAQPEAAA